MRELDLCLTEAVMMDAAKKYCQMSGEQSAVLKLFIIWFVSQHPDTFDAPPTFDAMVQKVRRSHLYQDRYRYFVDFLPFAASLFPRAIVASVGSTPKSPGSEAASGTAQMSIATFADYERDLFARVLQSTGGNKVHAANLLQISRKMLYTKIAKYGLSAIVPTDQEKNSPDQSSVTRSKSRTRPR